VLTDQGRWLQRRESQAVVSETQESQETANQFNVDPYHTTRLEGRQEDLP